MHARPRVLVTAFEPFGGRATNRSWQWSEAFVRESERSALAHVADIAVAQLPVDFVALPRALARLWRAERPDVWILAGESGRGDAIRVERVAVNLLDAALPDNAGRRRRDAPVVRGGPAAYFASLDPRAARHALEAAGVRAVLSLSAGTYCCNQAFYVARHLVERDGRRGRGGSRRGARVVFLHIPRASAGLGRPAPRLDDAARGLVRLVRSVSASRGRALDPARSPAPA